MSIVVGVDHAENQDRVVRKAAEIAAGLDEDLYVVHIMNQSRFRKLEETEVEQSGRTIPIDDIREKARQIAEETASNIESEFTPVGLVGDPKDLLLEFSEDNDASHVVVGNRKRSPVGKALFGNVTQSVLLNSTIPVITVPLDFED